MCVLSGCKYECQETPEGHLCYCPTGLTRTVDGSSCTEIPACEQWGVCSQKCVEINHHHKCY
ncbi:Low-density lipoprotein receptor-related protein 2, partial [Stegodyphus mimosarum]